MKPSIDDIISWLHDDIITPGECRRILMSDHAMTYDSAEYLAILNWRPQTIWGFDEPDFGTA